jgi:outer membrane protein assembly factor BamB
VSKGKLDGIDTRNDPEPAWIGTLSSPLAVNDSRLLSVAIEPTGTPFQGDFLRIESEIVRIRSLTINGAEREMHLDRGVAGTTASAHAAGAEIEAFRRAWRFPDDWHIRESGARGLDGIYGSPLTDSAGVMYAGDYGGWVYAFDPTSVNLDAVNDDDEPDVAVVDLGEAVIGGLALDEDAGLLYVTAAEELHAVSLDRLRASLAAGGGVVDIEVGFSFKAGGELWAAPAVEDGVVYLTSLDGKLYALDGATGNVNWSFDGG